MKVVTAGILRNDQESILLCRRAPGQSNAGFWEFPGGKQEVGESLEACLERELWEELDLLVQCGERVATSEYQYGHGCIQLVAFSAKILSGVLKLRVHDQVAWVPPARLLDYPLTPADVPVARVLITP
jgi:8-oxo-dGTP diphosphatase